MIFYNRIWACKLAVKHVSFVNSWLWSFDSQIFNTINVVSRVIQKCRSMLTFFIHQFTPLAYPKTDALKEDPGQSLSRKPFRLECGHREDSVWACTWLTELHIYPSTLGLNNEVPRSVPSVFMRSMVERGSDDVCSTFICIVLLWREVG